MAITVDFDLTERGTVHANQLSTGAMAVTFTEDQGAVDVALLARTPELARAKLQEAMDAVDRAETSGVTT
jgi:hypothetical protein